MGIASEAMICNMALGYAGVNATIDSLDDSSAQAQACKTYYEQYRDQLLTAVQWSFARKRAQLTTYSGAAWSTTTTYAAGDLVQYGAVVYKSLQDSNLNKDPTVESSWWFKITRDGWGYVSELPSDFLQALEQWVTPSNSRTSTGLTYQVQPPPPIRAPLSSQRAPFAIEAAGDGTSNRVLLTDIQNPVLHYTAQITDTQAFPALFIEALAWKLSIVLNASLRGDPERAAAATKMYIAALGEAVAADNRGNREDPEPDSEFTQAREA